MRRRINDGGVGGRVKGHADIERREQIAELEIVIALNLIAFRLKLLAVQHDLGRAGLDGYSRSRRRQGHHQSKEQSQNP